MLFLHMRDDLATLTGVTQIRIFAWAYTSMHTQILHSALPTPPSAWLTASPAYTQVSQHYRAIRPTSTLTDETLISTLP